MKQIEKVHALFGEFTKRYGSMELKDGQSMEAVERSWAGSVGQYSLKDLRSASQEWFATSKFSRWPEEGQFVELMRGIGYQPEREPEAMPTGYEQAQKDAARWYRGLIFSPPPAGWFPFTREECLVDFLNAYTDRARPPKRLFADQLVDAWTRGLLPRNFDPYAEAWIAKAQAAKGRMA